MHRRLQQTTFNAVISPLKMLLNLAVPAPPDKSPSGVLVGNALRPVEQTTDRQVGQWEQLA